MNPTEFSETLSQIVEKNFPIVVTVNARPAGSSGIVASSDGLIVTAEHTVDREAGIGVRLHDGRELTATLVGRDPTPGIAALRVPATGLAAVEWASLDSLKVGHLVLALTRPGRSVRASLGIVNALGAESWHTPAGGKLDRYLQSDLALQHGFSGGLLIDVAGRAIGMNNAGLLREAPMVIPGATIQRVLASLRANGRVRRGFLGIGAYPVALPPSLATEAGQEVGLLIISVHPGGPAEQAGLMLGDALLSLDGQVVTHLGQLQALLDEEHIGKTLAVRIVRAGKALEIKATVGARP